jgi:hypothetical protein
MASMASILEETDTPLSVLELPLRETSAGANRRSLPRVAGRFAVRADDGTIYEGLDLSFGGLMCCGAELCWPGTRLEFDLVLGGERKPLRLGGRVAELVPSRGRIAMRLRFDAAQSVTRRCIAEWMERTRGL